MDKQTASLETVSTFYQRDHRELEVLLKKVDFGSPGKSVPLFGEFAKRLERHIRWEEELLFPAVARKAPELEAGPIRVMRMEHQDIRKFRDAALEALKRGDGKAAQAATESMVGILADHNIKEEQILYPACDNHIPGADREKLYEEMRRIS